MGYYIPWNINNVLLWFICSQICWYEFTSIYIYIIYIIYYIVSLPWSPTWLLGCYNCSRRSCFHGSETDLKSISSLRTVRLEYQYCRISSSVHILWLHISAERSQRGGLIYWGPVIYGETVVATWWVGFQSKTHKHKFNHLQFTREK